VFQTTHRAGATKKTLAPRTVLTKLVVQYLDGNQLAALVVIALPDDAETTLSDLFHDLEPIVEQPTTLPDLYEVAQLASPYQDALFNVGGVLLCDGQALA